MTRLQSLIYQAYYLPLTSRVFRHISTLNPLLTFCSMIRHEFAMRRLCDILFGNFTRIRLFFREKRPTPRVEQNHQSECLLENIITLNTYQVDIINSSVQPYTNNLKFYHQHQSGRNRSSTIKHFF